jgi:peptidyl-prolyl cis-trans isomerase C
VSLAHEWFRRGAAASRRVLKGVLGEPLIHFLIFGGLIFGAYAFLERGSRPDTSSNEIQLSLDDLVQLTMLFESQWRRPPTRDEFNAMIEERIKGDILYREALARGLDKDDTIVKRRMAQKMQFLYEDMAAAREPTTKELKEWFAKNTSMFAMPPRLSFRHLYFSPDQRGDHTRNDALAALARIAGQPENSEFAASLGDSFMFQDNYGEVTEQAIARDFGPGFAQAVIGLKPGSWQGPIQSGYGWHLVFVESTFPGRIPAFEEVEQDVKTAWLGKQKQDAW